MNAKEKMKEVRYQTVEVNYIYTAKHRIIGTPNKMCKNEYLKWIIHWDIYYHKAYGSMIFFVCVGENNI